MKKNIILSVARGCFLLTYILLFISNSAKATIITAGDVTPVINLPGNFATPFVSVGDSVAGAPETTGNILINGGSVLTTTLTSIVGLDENGTATVDGNGSSWSAGRGLRIGDNGLPASGTASLDVKNGAEVSAVVFVFAGAADTTSHVTVSGLGSTLKAVGQQGSNDAVVLVGARGNATLDVTDQAKVTIDPQAPPISGFFGAILNIGGSLAVSNDEQSVGTVNVAGAGSEIRLKNDIAGVQVGRDSKGELNISDGALVVVENSSVNGLSVVGRASTAEGLVNVHGVNSRWVVGDQLFIGTEFDSNTRKPIAGGGVGVVNVYDGGTVEAGETVFVGEGGALRGGGGSIIGDIVNEGEIAPGNSAGLISVFGNVELTSTGNVEIQLGGTMFDTGVPIIHYDRIDVTDDAATTEIEGVLSIADAAQFNIKYFGGFTASLGDVFDVLVADDIVVNANALDIIFPALSPGLSWQRNLVSFGDGREAFRLRVSVPEPTTLAILGLGLAGLGVMRRRRTGGAL